MNQFQRLLVSLGCAAMATGFPVPGSADIRLKIIDTHRTNHPTTPINGISINMGTAPGSITTMPFFTCANRPCTVNLTDGTFELRDACGAPPLPRPCPATIAPDSHGAARIIKYEDASIQTIELKGLQIIDRLAGERRVTVGFGTDTGDFATVPAGSYPWAVVLSGTFTKRPVQDVPMGGGLTASCPSPYAMPPNNDACARLRLRIDGSDVDTSRPPPLRTVSIPCSNSPGSPAPCGGGNSYKTNGTFTSTLSGAVWLTEQKSVRQEMDLADVKFTALQQTFASMNSAVMAMSRQTEEDFGVENLFYSLADERDGDYWVYFSARHHFPPEPGTKRVSYFPPKEAITLTSIVTPTDWPSPIERSRNWRSYASFIPEPWSLQWKDVTRLVLAYDYVVDTFNNLKYSDCAKGSFYLRVALVNKRTGEEVVLPIYLGSKENDFRSGCDKAAGELNDVNLVKNDETRVAGSMTIRASQSQDQYGEAHVRSISVVVDQGGKEAVANYMVKLYNVRVNRVPLAGIPAAPGAVTRFAGLPRGARNTAAGKPGQPQAEASTHPILTAHSR